MGFEHHSDAQRFWSDLRDMLAKVSLEAQRRQDAAGSFAVILGLCDGPGPPADGARSS
jgi:hypothetical protein